MGLWGTQHDSVTNKPKHLTGDDKVNCYADNTGWTVAAGGNGNANAMRETLVAIGGLAGTSATTGLRTATVTSVRFAPGATATTDHTAGGGATVAIEVTWDEAVTIAGGNPIMKVVNSGGGTHDCVYTATGSTANTKVFKVAGQTLATGNLLSIGTALHDSIVLPGGVTIKDTASGTINSSRNLVAAVRTTHTVVA